MNKYIMLLVVLVVLIVGVLLYLNLSQPNRAGNVDNALATDKSAENRVKSSYTCPMHLSVHSDRPGACPVCGMALVKQTKMQEASGDELQNLQHVSLSASQRVIANVSTTAVIREDINKEVFAVGVVDVAEPLFQHISMRFPGRFEKLYLTFTGQFVKKGDPVAEVYSPEVISAQSEYLLMLESYDNVKDVADFASEHARMMVDQSKQKLSLWGFSENQLSELTQTKQVKMVVTIYSPVSGTVLKKNIDPQHYAEMGEDIYDVADLSKVWIYLDVYEKDLRFILLNHPVQVTTEAYPNETFKGKVTFIDPVINNATRTVRVRTEFANPNGKLKPQMYVKAQIHVPSSSALVVPATAVLFTGRRNVVWVEMKSNVFQPREVELGINSGSFIEVLSGLEEDDIVVTSGGYLLESESQLQQPGGSSGGHQHDGTKQESKSNMQPSGDGRKERNMQSGTTIIVDGNYSPNILHAKRGEKFTIAFERHDELKCTDEVVFKDFNVRQQLTSHQTTRVEFIPNKAGEYRFTCGMDMVEGTLIVHDEH